MVSLPIIPRFYNHIQQILEKRFYVLQFSGHIAATPFFCLHEAVELADSVRHADHQGKQLHASRQFGSVVGRADLELSRLAKGYLRLCRVDRRYKDKSYHLDERGCGRAVAMEQIQPSILLLAPPVSVQGLG